MSGLFVAFEGIVGSGKSTQVPLVANRLRGMGYKVTTTRSPGGTQLGASVRHLALKPLEAFERPIDPLAELYLMQADKAQLYREVIEPALSNNHIVICDRFDCSTIAYQGIAKGLGVTTVQAVCHPLYRKREVDVVFYFDLPTELALHRVQERAAKQPGRKAEARFDELPLEFHQLVANGYQVAKQWRLARGLDIVSVHADEALETITEGIALSIDVRAEAAGCVKS